VCTEFLKNHSIFTLNGTEKIPKRPYEKENDSIASEVKLSDFDLGRSQGSV
jgi:hypothetical protein